MRAGRSSSLALIAALGVVLGACAGESPTSPSSSGGGTTPGACTTSISLAATTVTPLAGTYSVVRATVTRGGVAVPDGTSVVFTVDFGYFGETGLPSVSKVTQNGFADVTLASSASGLAKLKATQDCATANLSVEFKPVPASGPYISTIEPNTGSCTGGDTVVLNGGRFVPASSSTTVEYRVLFGGAPGSIQSTSDTKITVKTPARTLANTQVPETVDVTLLIIDGPVTTTVTFSKGFTYFCVDPSKRMTVSSLSPSYGSVDGGDSVTINGNNFLPTPASGSSPGSSIATTQVTFGGVPASVVSVSQQTITVLTPKHVLADPTKGEKVDVSVTVDLGMPSKQAAILPQSYTYLPTFAGGACNTNPLLSIASVVPSDPATAGQPAGGDVVTINGIGFFAGYTSLPTNRVRVEFGGVAAVITQLTDTQIIVSTPARALANPQVSESVDVIVTVDLGGPRQSCAKAASAFTYRGTSAGSCTTSPNMFITSVVPADPATAGNVNGGEVVTINGGGFFVGYGSMPVSAVRVEFGGVPATITSVTNAAIGVLTPKRVLANPQVSETVDVRVIVDLAGPKQTCATAASAFTYRASQPSGTCATSPSMFITSVVPADPVNAGSTDGGDVVTINGAGFFVGYGSMPDTSVRVEFGGIPATVTQVSNTLVVVLTPRRVLANPQVAETVDVRVMVDVSGPKQTCATATAAFTYRATQPSGTCNTNPNLYISSVAAADPVNAGSADGGDIVTIAGGGFFAGYGSMPTTRVRVEFGGNAAVVSSVSDTAVTVTSPRRTLTNPSVPEAVDVVVTVDVGGAKQGCAKASSAFTYRATVPSTTCNTNPSLFISSAVPADPVNAGSTDGGDVVTLNGGGFFVGYSSMPLNRVRVEVGGVAAVVSAVSDTAITLTTPRRVLADPSVSETVDIAVTVDLGGAKQGCATISRAFTYRAIGPNSPCNTRKDLFISTVQPAASGTGSPNGGDSVTISGSGFFVGYSSMPASRVRVDFGGNPGVVGSVTNNAIVVTTPKRTLASPDRAETVDVVVTVDVGGAKQACASSPNAYTYYPGSTLAPVITSFSPNGGPNDVSTRVTIFGRNFTLPSQVFVGTAEATVVSISANEIVFMTPTAVGPNSSLAGGAWPIRVVDTRSGLSATSTTNYRYYSCPSVNGVSPSVAPWNATTIVTITGQNFEEPLEATFTPSNGGQVGQAKRIDVVSVTPSMVLVRMPAIEPASIQGAQCLNVTGTISLTPLALSCTGVTAGFTYRVDPMTVSSVTPATLAQDGCTTLGGCGNAGTTVTVTGAYFYDPITVEVYSSSYSVSAGLAVVSSSGTLSFQAPAVPSSAFATQQCNVTSTNPGVRWVDTPFGIRLTNLRTGCVISHPAAIVYRPAETSCRAQLLMGTVPTQTATLCTPYAYTVPVAGGTGALTYSSASLPTWLSLNPSTGQLTGTWKLTADGPGTVNPAATSVTINVADSAVPPATGSVTFPINYNDPGAVFTISGNAAQVVASGGGATGSNMSVQPTTFTPVAWTVTSFASTGGTPYSPALLSLTAPSASTTQLQLPPANAASVPAGTYNVTVQATDNAASACGGTYRHLATFNLVLTKNP